MLKLNPYAKTARRHAILKHNPEVRAAWAWHKSIFGLDGNLEIFLLSTDQG